MAIVAMAFGLFVTLFGPFLIQSILDNLLATIVPKIPEDPHLELAPLMIQIFFIRLRGIGMVAGITLFLIAYPFWKGEAWTWPMALSCISLPTIFGVITSLPYIVHVKRPPPAAIILLLGLSAYWIVLLLKRGDRLDKTACFIAFTLLGIVSSLILVLVMHGIKGLLDRPEKPFFTNPETSIYAIESPLNSIALVMFILAIPQLVACKVTDWWLGLIAGVTVILANYPTHFIRLKTSDFFVAGSLDLLLTISLLVPAFKAKLIVR